MNWEYGVIKRYILCTCAGSTLLTPAVKEYIYVYKYYVCEYENLFHVLFLY